MSTTATKYINLINQDYPVRGRDNDSQGFRDNFTNITQSLREINKDLDQLEKVSVRTDQTSTFLGNTIEDANFQNCSTELWDNGVLGGNITVDFSLGSYQKIIVDAGLNQVTIINWPGEGKSGELTLAVYPSSAEGIYSVEFVGDNVTSLGPSKNPYQLLPSANVFKIYSEFPAGSGNNVVHTRLLNEAAQITTSTTQVTTDELILNNKRLSSNASNNVKFTVSSATGALTATTVRSLIGSNNVVANLALVPNKVSHTIVSVDPTGFVSTNTANKIQLNSVEGILTGATFNLLNNTSLFTVTTSSSANKTVTCTPPFIVGIGSGSITFRNPTFSDVGEATAFPTVVTLVNQPATTSTGRVGTFKGSIYADSRTLEVTFNDFGNNIKNTFTATIMSVTTVTDKSTNLANTEFVHRILPYGSIIMWYGRVSEIPTGWSLCNGSNGTPDLRDKFVVGASYDRIYAPGDTSTVTVSEVAGTDSASTTTGGTAALILPYHEHASTATISKTPHTHGIIDPGHTHVLTSKAGVVETNNLTPGGSGEGGRNCTEASSSALIKNSQLSLTGITETEPANDNNSFNYSIAGTGTQNTSLLNYGNVPPFYALCFIMKVTGN
jgi:hypothetical protein